MSSNPKPGDLGATNLMYGRRVPKCHPRVEACGSVDELNAAIGLARASLPDGVLQRRLLAIQHDLVPLMGELATETEDLPRYRQDGFAQVSPEMTAELDRQVQELDARQGHLKGWAMPGENPACAALDLARTVCRRAERRVAALREAGQLTNPEVLTYLNRLSHLLWHLARSLEPGWAEPRPHTPS